MTKSEIHLAQASHQVLARRRVHRLVPGEGRFATSGSTTPRAVETTGDKLADTDATCFGTHGPTASAADAADRRRVYRVETRLRRDEAAVSETENQGRNVLDPSFPILSG